MSGIILKSYVDYMKTFQVKNKPSYSTFLLYEIR